MFHPICPLCRRKLEGPKITSQVLKSIKSRRSPTPPRTVVRTTTLPSYSYGNEAENLLLSAGVPLPSSWAAFLKTYRRVVNFHRENFPNVSFEDWVASLDSRTIAEIIRQFILT